MHTAIRFDVIALLLALGMGPAAAQTRPADIPAQPGAAGTVSPADPTRLQLSSEQKTAIINAVRQQPTTIRPSIEFSVAVGEMVPPSIELYLLPDNAWATIPQAKALKYTVVQNQIVLVDPITLRIVDVLR